MEDISIVTKVAWLGFALGGVFGATAQKTNFCTMGAISDMVMMEDWNRFRSWLLAIAVGIASTQALHLNGNIDINEAIYLTPNFGWFGAILGGLMFGFGMTLAGGCGSKTLVRLGAGNLKSLFVAVILGIFAYMTLRGLIALARVEVEAATNVDLAAAGIDNQGIPDFVGAAVGMDVDSVRAVVAAIAVAGLLWFCFKDADFRESKRDILGGVIIGLCIPGSWAITGIFGFDDFEPTALASISFVAPVANSIQYLMTFSGATIDFGISTVGGVIVGSFLAAKVSGEFRIEAFNTANDMLRHLLGASLMGIGGVMALGCTIGQGLSGISTLAVGSLLALLSIVFGGVLGIKFLEEGSLGGAISAMFKRG